MTDIPIQNYRITEAAKIQDEILSKIHLYNYFPENAYKKTGSGGALRSENAAARHLYVIYIVDYGRKSQMSGKPSVCCSVDCSGCVVSVWESVGFASKTIVSLSVSPLR